MTFGAVACIASLVSARGRRLGDVFAGALVVRERVPGARVMPVPPPPPWLAGRFSGLDLSAVPDGLWLAIRQYLTRMNQLDPQVGAAMAARLADDLVARTGAPPPVGVPAAAFLMAVVHERQARDAARAFGPVGPAGFGAPVPGGPVPAAPALVAPVMPVMPVVPAAAGHRSCPGGPARRARGARTADRVRTARLSHYCSNVEGGVSRCSSSMPGAERTTSPARWTGWTSPVSRAVTWYSSTTSGPLSVACSARPSRAQAWSTVRGPAPGR